MPLVKRQVSPVRVSSGPLDLRDRFETEFGAVNNKSVVNVLRQLASLVTHAAAIFGDTADQATQVACRIKSVKLKLDELEAKSDLFDPKLVPVPEGSVDDVTISTEFKRQEELVTRLFCKESRPKFLISLYEKAGRHQPNVPVRDPIPLTPQKSLNDSKRPASIAAMREWKLDDYLDEKIATLRKKPCTEELHRALASPFPSQLVQVDVTGQGFDRMKRNRRSLVIHTKRIRNKKRRNTICGAMPNKECGIQTSFSSVNCPQDGNGSSKGYGVDSGHWSSSGGSSGQEVTGDEGLSPLPSPWDPTLLSTSMDFLFEDEDRCLTPQLENFTDCLVSDSDSVDTDGYFTSFRSDCGFPKAKKSPIESKEDHNFEDKQDETNRKSAADNEYELFGKGSTSTTASSCGTVVLRQKPSPPVRTTPANEKQSSSEKLEESSLEERVQRKSMIERVASLVVVTPSPSVSSGSPPPLKEPPLTADNSSSDFSFSDLPQDTSDNESAEGKLTPSIQLSEGDPSSTDCDSELASSALLLSGRTSTESLSSTNSTSTLTVGSSSAVKLPQPDVIPDLQLIRTKGSGPKLDVSREYFSLDTVLLGSSAQEERRLCRRPTAKTDDLLQMELDPGQIDKDRQLESPSKSRGARVVLDANGQIIFASETLRRKRKPKVSFEPGEAVKMLDYDSLSSSNYGRVRESVYDRLKKQPSEKLYECIEEIRKENLRHPFYHMLEEKPILRSVDNDRCSSASSTATNNSSRYATRPRLSPPSSPDGLLETDLDSPIPPVMPELKNLPLIRDRLKRNESYRIANKEEAEQQSGAQKSAKGRIASEQTKLKASSPNIKNSGRENREIPEEDPLFVQRILELSSGGGDNSSIFSNKLPLSPEDRPSFLRRDSTLSMDDIAKETYRFRKKFNIKATPTLRNASSPNSEFEVTGRCRTTIPLGFPTLQKTPPRGKTELASAPVSTTHDQRRLNSLPMRGGHQTPTGNENTSYSTGTRPELNSPYSTGSRSQLNSPYSTGSRPQLNPPYSTNSREFLLSPHANSNMGLVTKVQPTGKGGPLVVPNRKHSLSPNSVEMEGKIPHEISKGWGAKPSLQSLRSSAFSSGYSSPLGHSTPISRWAKDWRRNSIAVPEATPTKRTSLSDFKKLLETVQRKKNTISAMEVLKPRVGLETTI